jgi:hypothetical protein
MRKVCAWCKKELSAGDHRHDDVISHGICTDCMEYFASGKRVLSLREYLDRLDVPVVVVDDDLRVVTANGRARSLFGKELPEIEGSYSGNVLECAYSRHPGGCGTTVHCRTCTIRNTVTDTYRTAKSHVKVPAYANRQSGDGEEKVRFLISTEKAGAFVLLRIDEVSAR